MATQRRKVFTAVAFLAAIALAGCSSHAAASYLDSIETYTQEQPIITLNTAASWVQPEWMTEAAISVSEYQNAMADCLETQGIIAQWMLGSFVIPGGPRSADLIISASGQREISQMCYDLVPLPSHWATEDAERNEESFSRMLDTRACLVANGIDISPAPSLSTWILLGWNPWEEVSRDPNYSWFNHATQGELGYVLVNACPQDGMSRVFLTNDLRKS